MVCNNCGKDNPGSSRFCEQCGAPLQAPQAPPQVQYAPPPNQAPQGYAPPYQAPPPGYAPYQPQPGYAPPKPKRKGLIAGLIIGGVLLLAGAAAAVYFFVLAGTPITGLWYSDDLEAVLKFTEDGGVTNTMLTGVFTGTYEYDKRSGTGTLTAGGGTGDITVEKDVLTMESPDGGKFEFKKAGEDFDTEEYLLEPLIGFWSNADVPEVIEIKTGGKLTVYNLDGEEDGEYSYDFKDGEGSIEVYGSEYTFAFGTDAINLEGVGEYAKESKNFDTDEFLEENSNPVAGVWYDLEGKAGAYTFLRDGTYTSVIYGQESSGTYDYDKATGNGHVNIEDGFLLMTPSDNMLYIDGRIFTRDYVEQKGADDYYEDILGIWYDTEGLFGTMEFFADGTGIVIIEGYTYYVTVTLDPITAAGEVDYGDIDYKESFYVQDGLLIVNGVTYGRDYVEQAGNPLLGTWYDIDGELGTLSFYGDGSAELYSATEKTSVFGIYQFDYSLQTGTVTLTYGTQSLTLDIALDAGFVVLSYGEDEVVLTLDYVEQGNK